MKCLMDHIGKGVSLRLTHILLDRFRFPPQTPVVRDPLLHATYYAADGGIVPQSTGIPWLPTSDWTAMVALRGVQVPVTILPPRENHFTASAPVHHLMPSARIFYA